ncbi:TPA: AAA family ATPase [Enterobacter hormaechei subsp. steigerwaltii]|uniref:AAA family ATPase n=1 Tax=Enterobacter hormaechei TaxID=158836 RepID=UPI0028C97FFA|nr:AAA family ATPase [Enterobacter hormaechei]ELJ6239346.1 AAA family ATPase [Enterobacter hormaechei]ELJ6240568.1 AAA family ATPase [Enterobacter hormaechei]ELZ5040530.1 AAA family ATPase [Enterobacter hormaechei]ELZ5043709.1 AAA family ATPase [Enterobacter hormaechei]WNT31286.1 AAA family ATPase [Enterobacter hormaechei]
MSKISKIDTYNIINKGTVSELDLNKRITILTGYNGSGKTTLLKAIHETIAIYNDTTYPHKRKGLAVDIYFENSYKIRNFTLPEDARQLDLNDQSFVAKHVKITDKLDLAYKKLLNSLTRNNSAEKIKSKDNIKIGEDSKKNSSYNGLVIFPKDNSKKLSSILYCDELFFFSDDEDSTSKEKLEELDVYSRSNNLAKTLYILLQEFSKESILNEKEREKIDAMNEIKSMLDYVPEDRKLSLEKTIRELEEKSDYKRELNDFIAIVNSFFELTNRKIFIDNEGLISLEYKENYYKWFDFSKGEMTLLSLLLVVYLHRNENVIFLFDEPDLSLHIKWQKNLISKLAAIAPSSQFIISTHSPALIGNYNDQSIINISSLSRGE